MFNRVGAKLKALAEAISLIGICTAIVWGGITIEGGIYRGMVHGPTLLLGLCIAIGGSIGVWLVSLFIYGFGQLIENTDRISEQPKSRICTRLIKKVEPEEKASINEDISEEIKELKEEEGTSDEEVPAE